MDLTPIALLAGYSAAILAAAVFGAWLDAAVRLTHTRVQAAMSFVAGLILGVALYHLIPLSVSQISAPQAIEVAAWWTATGMITMVLLLRVFHFHQHEFGDHVAHREDQSDAGEAKGHSLSWVGVCVGLGMHTLTEGAALGASVRGGQHDDGRFAALASLGIFLAICLHKPLDSLSIQGLMRLSGFSRRSALGFTLGIAILCPLGAFATYWGIGLFGAAEGEAIGRALAFGAGALICVSLSDLLPEIRFHGHDRFPLTLAFLAGISLAYGLHYLEGFAEF